MKGNNASIRLNSKTVDNVDKLCERYNMSRTEVLEIITAFFVAYVSQAKYYGKAGMQK